MQRKRNLIAAGMLAVSICALGASQARMEQASQVQAPVFEVDPFWPKPLPNNWVLGQAIGVAVDSRDHVYIVHRRDQVNPSNEGAADRDTTAVRVRGGPPLAECCVGAPPVLEFDPEGNLVRGWGGPGQGYTWPGSNHGIAVDNKDNVWIGGNGTNDSHILKFTRDGKLLMEIGIPGQGARADSKSTERFGRVAKISFDLAANEAYAADGYLNKRVAVIDMETGKIKRFWGAYGNMPSDSNYGGYDPDAPLIPQFRTPVHCAEPSLDGFVYVCDRPNDRIQVFQKDGKFVREVRIAPRTLGDGSVWDITFSPDAAQKYLYLADGKNEKVYIMDRQSLEILTSFGDGGRQPGQFFAVHSIVTDSKGNIFTTETYDGRRLQKFVFKGMGAVTKKDQGTVWPRRGGGQ
jgi:DNA-binding beta-propeller fold protein YncE